MTRSGRIHDDVEPADVVHAMVVGAGGFVGSRVVARLLGDGTRVTCAGRDEARLVRLFPRCRTVAVDLACDPESAWLARLEGIDLVVDASGALGGDLERVQASGPMRLLNACAEAGVSRVVRISALGAGERPDSPFLETKAKADRHLLRLARDWGYDGWCVLRPSIVLGRGGATTSTFLGLAAAPVQLRLGPGSWRLQPVHVADLADLVAEVARREVVPPTVDVVGPEAMTTDELTSRLRAWLGLPATRVVGVPTWALAALAWAGSFLPDARLTRETLALLAAGNVSDATPGVAGLAWRARPVAEALAREPSTVADVQGARTAWVRPVATSALWLVWVWTGIASLLVPASRVAPLLAGLGLAGPFAVSATVAGAVLDVALGMALLPRRARRRVAMVQAVVVLAYTALATVAAPSLWLDPFAPLLKNLAVVVLCLVVACSEP